MSSACPVDEIVSRMERFLLQRDRAESEARDYMKRRRLCAPEDVDAVVLRLYDLGWLNEARFARERVLYRQRAGYGPAYIRSELMRLGLPSEVVADALEAAADDFAIAVREVLDRKLRGSQKLVGNQRERWYHWLRRRGHSSDLARKMVDELGLVGESDLHEPAEESFYDE
ncbi:MAG: regulatory protein RecX [Spirochaetales bacterium]|nr:regulatory protein RecX [Leptospiraceae bacterium]MCP5480324.1 regulatory protein RecX [Spirochaetales bacterium]